jgi:beta-ribofuranosylaminobenzene 5'-phosphate synthase
MIRIRTASRLHFGLFSPTVTSGRRFGGLGLMVHGPGIDIALSTADKWSVAGPLAERGWNTLQRLTKLTPFLACPPLHVKINDASLEHQGLGTGTQFDLALARGVAEFTPSAPQDALTLAALANRGQRSAIGTHGFAQGGFLVDAGKREAADTPAPLLLRLPFPEEWRVLLLRPKHLQGPAGRIEREKFLALPADTLAQTERLCRLALLEIVPSLLEKNFRTFAQGVHEFNARVGEMFHTVQGGTYAHPTTARLIAILDAWGCLGAGQSSWGPTVFAFAEKEREAEQWRDRLRLLPEAAGHEVIITKGENHGARIERV